MTTAHPPLAGLHIEELDRPFPLAAAQIDAYREHGYLKLKDVFSPQLLAHYAEAISARVAELSADVLPLAERGTYGKAFLQVMNLWTESEAVRKFVFGERLAGIAAGLMQVDSVRLYHDQALYKEPGGGITPWHADQFYWPVDGDKTITAWVPLQPTPLAMGPLAFCRGSQRLTVGRNLAIGDESERTLEATLAAFDRDEGPFSLGEVSFHSGWTFHRAGGNSTAEPRRVMTVIYMDAEIRLTAPANRNQAADIERWAPGQGPGERLGSPLNPVLYSRAD